MIGNGEIEKIVASGACRLVEPRQMLLQPMIGILVVEIALEIAHPLGEPTPRSLIKLVLLELAIAGDRFLHHCGESVAPFLHSIGISPDTDEPKSVGKSFRSYEIVERRHEQTLRQVASGAEDDHGAGRRFSGRLGPRHARGLDEPMLYV